MPVVALLPWVSCPSSAQGSLLDMDGTLPRPPARLIHHSVHRVEGARVVLHRYLGNALQTSRDGCNLEMAPRQAPKYRKYSDILLITKKE